MSEDDILKELMVVIPHGQIRMRDDRIKKVWSVEISGFLLAKYPVTQQLYSSITGDNPSAFKGSQKPVECVSWNDAVMFCNMLSRKEGMKECYSFIGEEVEYHSDSDGFRLPLEAEWEYACRAGERKAVYGNINEIAWYKENSGNETNDVGLKYPNRWGLFDMLGNVWEWCWDQYDKDAYGAYRVFRGGGWNDEERGCLASNRRRSHPTFRMDDLGFRIARSGI